MHLVAHELEHLVNAHGDPPIAQQSHNTAEVLRPYKALPGLSNTEMGCI